MAVLYGGCLVPAEPVGAPRIAVARRVGVLPPKARVPMSSPQHQLAASSCYPTAVAFALESDVVARTGAHVQASIMDPYWGLRVLAGDWPNDVGSYPHHGETWYALHGTLSSARAPYDAAKVTTWQPDASWAGERKAWTAKLERMPADIDQFKGEIAAGRCVIICHHVTAQMEGHGPGQAGRTGLEVGIGPGLGGHARCLVSYDDATGRWGCINWWRRWGVACPWDSRFADSYSEIPYDLAVDPRWLFYAQRIAKGLEVEV